MKRVLILILALAISAGTALFSGCVGKRGPGVNGELTIRYYGGGCGEEWIAQMAAEFEEEAGVTVHLKKDNKMTENASTLLESGRDLPDLMFCLYTNWQAFVQKGWLEPMDEIYDGTLDSATGISATYDGKKLTETMVPEFVNYGLMKENIQAEEHYYVMPWTAPVTGLVYNVKLLEQVGYSEPPKTEAELKDLCNKLNAAGITPFAWGGYGMEMGYWDFPTLTWWAQYSGVETWEAFYEFENAEVFLDQGRVEALRLFQELIVDESGNWKNSISSPAGRDHMDAQRAFVKGEAAMMPTGSWIENEVGDFIADDFEMRMMYVPAIEGAKETNVVNTEAGDFACIPKGAANKENAKAFLAFMNRPEQVEKFTVTTGVPRPFQYQPTKLEGITDFQRSCFEMFENGSCMYRVSTSPIFTYVGVREWNPYGKQTVYGMLAGQNKLDPETVNRQMYEDADAQWDNWVGSFS